jgi:hypothetical protein
VHAAAAPIYFAVVSIHYFTRYGYTTPWQTALVFTGFVAIVDFFVVAMVILRSLEMFGSPLGTWIPFALIFMSTWLTGHAVTARRRAWNAWLATSSRSGGRRSSARSAGP